MRRTALMILVLLAAIPGCSPGRSSGATATTVAVAGGAEAGPANRLPPGPAGAMSHRWERNGARPVGTRGESVKRVELGDHGRPTGSPPDAAHTSGQLVPAAKPASGGCARNDDLGTERFGYHVLAAAGGVAIAIPLAR